MTADAAEKWLEENAIDCARYKMRISPNTCAIYRRQYLERCRNCERARQDAQAGQQRSRGTDAYGRRRLMTPQEAREKASKGGLRSSEARRAKSKEEPMQGNKPVRVCADCGETKPICARGLCGACWQRHKKAGTLERFESKKPGAGAHAEPAADAAAPEEPSPCESAEQLPEAEARKEKGKTHLAEISIRFYERDADLYEDLLQSAKEQRRSVSAEVLVRLDRLGSYER